MTTRSASFIELTGQAARARPRLRAQLAPNERRALLALVDLFVINGALLIALQLWQGFTPGTEIVLGLAKWWLTLSVLWGAFAITFDLYNLARAASVSSIAGSTATAAALTALAYVLIPWLTPVIDNRSYVFGFGALAIFFLTSWRVIYARWLASGSFYRRILILGTGKTAHHLAAELDEGLRSERANPYRGTGYQVIGLVAPPGERADDARVLGEVNDLVSIARELDIEDVVVAIESDCGMGPEVYEALLDCRELGIQVSSVEAISERLTSRLPVEYARYDLAALLNLRDQPVIRLYLVFKRFFDICFSLLALVFLAFLAPVIALVNRLTSPGPLFYEQERIGIGSRPFRVLKFRSMRVDAEATTGAVWSANRDPRITPIGRLLRKTRIDELPQVVNVLRGEMSVVGPRPERPNFVGQLSEEIPVYRARHAVRPGITGWAQVHYGYGNSVEDSRIKLEYDLYYVRHFGLYLDLLILLRTVMVVVQFKGR
ncbi:MAG: sugar transferase [Anaerolineae bacterium]|jgi:exopolysaccharide biosynthesis polyprenyl glycosylphosphotransferase|nr:sugar transferase [Anaerolineae bacterium]